MKRVLKYFAWTVVALVALAAVLVWYVRSNDDAFAPYEGGPMMIAHAGGAIDGVVYTNSREAVEHSLEAGFSYIELDLVLSSDGRLIAFHTNPELPDTLYSTDPPSHAEFKSKLIYGRYTPLDGNDVALLLAEHPAMKLVVDKTDDPDVLDCHFARYRDRVWVECFSMEAYVAVCKRGYHGMLNVWSFGFLTTIKQDLKHLVYPEEPRVGPVVINYNIYNGIYKKKLNWLNRPAAFYTVDNMQVADSLAQAVDRTVLIYCDNR